MGVVKNGLRKAMYNKPLFYDDIVTLLKEVQVRVNNRPLTYTHSDDPCLDPLTPNHLLRGRRINVLPSVVLLQEEDPMYNDPERLQLGYSQLSQMIERFKKCWREEYLTALREKHLTVTNNQVVPVKVGDIVLVECTTHREHWPLARVTKIFPDPRGQVRAVEILLDGQLTIKTLNKLVNLEVPIIPEIVQDTDQGGDDLNESLVDSQPVDESLADSPHQAGDSAEGTVNSRPTPPMAERTPRRSRPRRRAAKKARKLFVELGRRDDI